MHLYKSPISGILFLDFPLVRGYTENTPIKHGNKQRRESGENMVERDEIIAKAVMQKLTDGIEFFTADDILKVAGIDNTKLRQIHETIKKKSLEAALPLEEIG